MRLNLGSGRYPLEGWTNVDAYCPADVEGDIRELSFDDVDEVNMSHLLEHFSWRETEWLLEHVWGWMRAGTPITVEVPDMEAIMARGTVHPLWFKYVYGDQSTPGEAHLAGFTARMLGDSLRAACFCEVEVQKAVSDHRGREGMPVLVATAKAEP